MKPKVEWLKLRKSRGKTKKDERLMRQTERYRILMKHAREFRAIGNLLCKSGETFKDRLNGAIATGLAEVCEMLAQAAEE